MVELPPRRNEVVVPASAVVETGEDGIVYVAKSGGEADRSTDEYVRRRVVVAHRGRNFVHVRTQLTDDEKTRGLTTLDPNDRVVISGIVLLENAWKELGLTQADPNQHLANSGARDH